jgi:hypothetical protein
MEVTYEVIQSTLPAPDMKAPGRKSVLPAAAKLAHWLPVLANDRLLKWQMDKELVHMAPELKKARGSKQGVLVVVQIKEWNIPDTAGTRAKNLHEILIGPAGNDAIEVYRNFMMGSHMHSGPGKGWRLSPKHLWVTAP